MPPEFSRKWGTECLITRFPSAYAVVCGIQREADKKNAIYDSYSNEIDFLFHISKTLSGDNAALSYAKFRGVLSVLTIG